MSKKRKKNLPGPVAGAAPRYEQVLEGVIQLLEHARRTSARVVNGIITATYWDIGRRVVEFEQGGKDRAAYGTKLVERLSADLTAMLGRGFSKRNLEQMRLFYIGWPIAQTLSAQFIVTTLDLAPEEIEQTLSVESQILQTLSGKSARIYATSSRKSSSADCLQTLSATLPEKLQTPSEESHRSEIAQTPSAQSNSFK